MKREPFRVPNSKPGKFRPVPVLSPYLANVKCGASGIPEGHVCRKGDEGAAQKETERTAFAVADRIQSAKNVLKEGGNKKHGDFSDEERSMYVGNLHTAMSELDGAVHVMRKIMEGNTNEHRTREYESMHEEMGFTLSKLQKRIDELED